MHWLLWGKCLKCFFSSFFSTFDFMIIPPQADVQSLMSWCKAKPLLWFFKDLVEPGELFFLTNTGIYKKS